MKRIYEIQTNKQYQQSYYSWNQINKLNIINRDKFIIGNYFQQEDQNVNFFIIYIIFVFQIKNQNNLTQNVMILKKQYNNEDSGSENQYQI
ncbi:unnamed protein product [Paramecium sonneborni]|uniref:Uncharacterized protein n=1 Tax=Paramecium sonneborni TaxID=65129 RepID=A0A8S1PTT4_9CILI|nr:unnamed protein product [Paramecium sonneborni]